MKEGRFIMILSIIDFIKDIKYTVNDPHVNSCIVFLLWISIFAPLLIIFTNENLGNFSVSKTF